MTFAQLQSFALVARLGSVKAAAQALGVSEPAVSEAVTALRRDLGDPLFVRSGTGIALTAGGTRLAAGASEILGLARQVRREVGEARSESPIVRLAATPAVAEYVVPPLLDAFTRRSPSTEVTVQVEPAESFPDLLADRLTDVTLGPPPASDGAPAPAIEASPFLRYRLIVLAAPGHRLAGRGPLGPAALAGERWLVGASAAGPETALGAFLAANRLDAAEVRAFPSQAAALQAVEGGRGITLAIAHTVLSELRRGALARLDVRGTPIDGLWHVGTLARERLTPAAAALRTFVATTEAMQAIVSRSGDVPAGRFRTPVYITLWSGG
jgi:DNA-binding transcriptional LysR family regulator